MSFTNYLKFFRKYRLFTTLAVLVLIPLLFIGAFNLGFLILTLILMAIFAVKIMEWVDDRYVDDKIGGWITKQDLIFIKVIPKASTNYSCIDMEKFLLLLHATYGSRSQKNFRIEGKFYEEFCIELHSDKGQVEMYIKMYKNSYNTFIGATKLYFPDITFELSEDPFKTWPKTWQEMSKIYSNFDGGEFGLAQNEIYPIKFYEQIKTGNHFYQKTPINQLIAVLQNIQDDYICIQFIIRPQDSSSKQKSWSSELTKLKKELATNTAVAITSTGATTPYTPQEIALIESVQRKTTAPSFDTKIRFMFLGKTSTGKKNMSPIMAYWKNFATEKQTIIPKPKSWDEATSATFGPFWDTLYWKPETQRRSRIFYKASLSRGLFSGGKSNYWDVHSLASILQFPNMDFNISPLVQEIEANTTGGVEYTDKIKEGRHTNLDEKIRKLKEKYS